MQDSKDNDRVVERFDLERIRKHARIPLICVYDHPTDYPDAFIARVWDGASPTQIVAVADTLQELRNKIPEHMVRLDKNKGDDPCIVEVWI